MQLKLGESKARLITKYNYACILSLLTYYITLLPFYSDNDPKVGRDPQMRLIE